MDKFLEEYSSEDSIKKYTKKTAGYGISYLLENDYGNIYIETIRKYIPDIIRKSGLRIIEFGCGGGMNLIHLVSMLEKNGYFIQSAYGTDFSEKLIDAAKIETANYLSHEQQKKVVFCVARNESLIQDLTDKLGIQKASLLSSFHLILGVNTFRYCHRSKKELQCTRDILDLLMKEGVCIMIDMNDKFPVFRSKISDRLNKSKEEYHIPSLDEYARPFSEVGFKILKKENFCWIPHSAGLGLTKACKLMAPFLNMIAQKYAMRSLVISKKTI